MEYDEVTSAVATDLADMEFAPLELKYSMPTGQQGTLHLPRGGMVLGKAPPLHWPGEEWSVQADERNVRLQRLQGQGRLQAGAESRTEAALEAGDHFELHGCRFWVVDVRHPFLATLEGCSGDYLGKSWSLGYQDYRVGRRGAQRVNEIELNHPTVSRAQACFSPAEDGNVVLCCETANSPVRVNGANLASGQRAPLRSGDSIQFGELAFRFRQVKASGQTSYFPTDGTLPPAIGRYRIVGRLGAGGMGLVYEGLGPEGEQVAIKVPLPHLLADEDFLRRFNREMKLGAALSHARLTRIVDFEPAGADRYPYLVMEKLSGTPVDRVPLPLAPEQALEWAGQLLEGLEYLHGQGVLHRDLKPSNLFHTQTGLKIGDLGIAHWNGTVAERLTQTGSVLGTAAYLDPHALRGNSSDARSDLYAAGLILYEWLAGKLPYPEDSLQVFRLKLSEDLPPLRQACPGLPDAIYLIVDLLTHREPERRFSSAGEALYALSELRQSLVD